MLSETIQNLTTANEIFHAFLIKDSRNALSKFADSSGFTRPNISQHIHGHRKNQKILQQIANHLACGIYGVMPDKSETGQNRPERKDNLKEKCPVPRRS